MSRLPAGWSTASLEEISGAGGLVTDGDWIESKDQDPEGNVRLIQLMDIGDGHFTNRSKRFLNERTAERLRCTKLCAGDVLIARMPDPLGRACVFPGLDQEAVTAVDVLIWRAGEGGAVPEWLQYAVNSPHVRDELALKAGGTTRQRVAGGVLKKLELPLPPLAEQRRIVAKLDAMRARTARARGALDRVPALAARYKQAVLCAAFDGKFISFLAVAKRVTVEDVATQIFDGPFGSNLKSSDYTASGVRVVRLENIAHLAFVEDKRTYISESKFEGLRRHSLQDNDVLFSSFVDEQVRVCVLPQLATPAINKADCFSIRLDRSRCDPRFLAYRLASKSTFDHFEALVHGATRPRINLRQLKAFEFDLPPLTIQIEIVRRIDAAIAEIDRLTAEAAASLRLLDRLDQMVLARAFSGKLVPQDPVDEPATILLDRIRADRAAAPVKRGRRAAA